MSPIAAVTVRHRATLALLLIAAAIGGAEGDAMGGDRNGLLDADLGSMPLPVGIVCLVLGLVFILVGWRLAVLQVAIATGIVCALLGWRLGQFAALAWVPPVAAIAGGIAGLLLGRWVYRIGGALNGALVLGLVGLLPGLILDMLPVMVAGGIVAGVFGLLLGWRYVRHCDAIATSLAGGALIGVGAIALARHFALGETMAQVIGLCGLGAGAALGIMLQLKDVGHVTRLERKKAEG